MFCVHYGLSKLSLLKEWACLFFLLLNDYCLKRPSQNLGVFEYVWEQVEVLTEGVTREDKILVISLAIFLSLAAGLLLEFLPAQYLDFQWESATAELGWLVTSVRRKLDMSMMVSIPCLIIHLTLFLVLQPANLGVSLELNLENQQLLTPKNSSSILST